MIAQYPTATGIPVRRPRKKYNVHPVLNGRSLVMSHGTAMMAPAKCRLLNEAEPSAGRGAFAMDL